VIYYHSSFHDLIRSGASVASTSLALTTGMLSLLIVGTHKVRDWDGIHKISWKSVRGHTDTQTARWSRVANRWHHCNKCKDACNTMHSHLNTCW